MTTNVNNWNQIYENITCNSESYNPIYDLSDIDLSLFNIDSAIDSLIQSNRIFIGKMLNIHTFPNVQIQDHRNNSSELNCRGLILETDNVVKTDVNNNIYW